MTDFRITCEANSLYNVKNAEVYFSPSYINRKYVSRSSLCLSFVVIEQWLDPYSIKKYAVIMDFK